MALPTKPKEWIDGEWLVTDSDGAQTNAVLIAGVGAHEIVARRLTVVVDGDNSAAVGCRIGWGTAAAPTALPTAALAGVEGVPFHHPDIAAGSGVHMFEPEELFRVPAGRSLLMTCEDPAGGSLVVTCKYMYVPTGRMPKHPF